MSPLQIILRQREERLVVFAAEELQRYVRRLFGFHPPICRAESGGEAETSILLGGDANESLSE